MREINNYLYFLKAISNLACSSEEVYRSELLRFFHFLKKTSLNIEQDDILHYLEYIRRYAVSTARRKVAIVKSFFRYLETQNIIPASPFNKIYRPIRPGNNIQKQNKHRPTLTREQIRKLLSSEALVSKMSFEELRNEVIVRLFLATGVRRKELLSLKTTDIDFENNEIIIRSDNAKRKKERIVFFDKITARWVKWYFARMKSHKKHKQTFVFISRTGRTIGLGTLRRLIEDKFEKIGLGRNFRCHLFRHTCATMLLEHGAEPKVVQEVLGHERIDTTLDTYTHLSQEYLRKVYRKANPFRDFDIQVEEKKELSIEKEKIKFEEEVK